MMVGTQFSWTPNHINNSHLYVIPAPVSYKGLNTTEWLYFIVRNAVDIC